jgi:hypothetical protein
VAGRDRDQRLVWPGEVEKLSHAFRVGSRGRGR